MKRSFTKLKNALRLLIAAYLVIPTGLLSPVFANADPSVKNPNPAFTEIDFGQNKKAKLYKSAKSVPGVTNKWDITLRIESPKSTRTSDTVIVIDRSGSMEGTKLSKAKSAAKTLAGKLLTNTTTNRVAVVSFAEDATINRNFTNNLSQVEAAINGLNAYGGTFTQAGMKQAADLVAGSGADIKNVVFLSDGKPTYSYRISNLNTLSEQTGTLSQQYIDRATRIDGNPGTHGVYGNRLATTANIPKARYQDSRVGGGSSVFHRYDPLNSSAYPSSSDKYYNHGNSAIAEAGFYKAANDKGYLYTIALDAGPEGNAVLNSMASPGKAYTTTNPNDLEAIFQAIGGEITNALQNASVLDTMGTGFAISPSSAVGTAGATSLSWTPVFTEVGNQYVAEVTYTIQTNDSIFDATPDAEGFYRANASAILTYNNNQTASFPIPYIKPSFVSVSKVLTGQTCPNCTFDVTLTDPAQQAHLFTVKHGETQTIVKPMLVGDYSVLEVGTANNPVSDISKYTISYSSESVSIAQGEDAAVTVTNDYVSPIINVTATKTWENGPVNNRPDIWFTLYRKIAGGTATKVAGAETKKLSQGTTQVIWEGLDETDADGHPYIYSVQETDAEGNSFTPTNYNKVEDALTVTNSYTIPKTSVTATKVWDGGTSLTRPDIWFTLYRNITGTNPAIVSGADIQKLSSGTTQVTWNDLDETDINGNPYIYSVRETTATGYNFTPENYTKTEDGLTVTNKYTPPKTDITVNKTWTNGPTPRPLITVNLLRGTTNENLAVYKTTTLADGQLSHTWANEDRNDPVTGTEYIFKVEEAALSNYNITYGDPVETGLTITLSIDNSYFSDQTSVTATKVWDGGTTLERPDIWFTLHRNIAGTNPIAVSGAETQLLEDGTTEVTWDNLDETDINGNTYIYSVKETDVNGNDFTPENYTKTENGLTVTNKYTPPKTDITVNKTWTNGSALNPTITVHLLRGLDEDNLSIYKTVQLSRNNSTHTWANEDRNDPVTGTAYIFKVQEDVLSNYTITYGDPVEVEDETGLTITLSIDNKYTSPTTSITATKEWDGGSTLNRPDIWFTLYRKIAGGDATKVAGAEIKKLSHGTTEVAWDGLDETDIEGNTYIYSVEETDAEGNDFTPENYTKTHDGDLKIVNTYNSPTTSITATKEWDGGTTLTRPDIWFTLYRKIAGGDATKVTGADIQLLQDGTTEATWEGLDKTDAEGNDYIYSVEETDAEGNDFTPENYTKTEDGLTVTNKYVSPKTSITVNKVWTNGPTPRPAITIDLLRGITEDELTVHKTVTLTDGQLSHTWANEDRNDPITGKEYIFKVQEAALSNYDITYGDLEEAGLIITLSIENSYVSPKTDISATKEWQKGSTLERPDIWFTLYRKIAGGSATKVTDAEVKKLSHGTTEVTWEGMDVTDLDGEPYIYSVQETDAEGNDSTPENYVQIDITDNLKIINQYVSPKTKVSATKEWQNGSTLERPDIWFTLYRKIEGGEAARVTGADIQLLQDGTTEVTWDGLDKTDAEGNDYIYSVEETDAEGNDFTPENYTKEHDGDLKIVNCYVSPKADVSATKEWVNGSTLTRPDIWFTLYRKIASDEEAVVVDEADVLILQDGTTEVTWYNLDETDIEGNAYIYSVMETDADGNDFTPENYTKLEEGLTVINTYASPITDISAIKTWRGGTTLTRPNIWFTLYRQIEGGDATIVDEAEIMELVHGTTEVTWEGLDETDIEGNTYIYSVKETNEDGEDFTPENYKKLEAGLEVINIYIPPKVPNTGLTGQRAEDHGIARTASISLAGLIAAIAWFIIRRRQLTTRR